MFDSAKVIELKQLPIRDVAYFYVDIKVNK